MQPFPAVARNAIYQLGQNRGEVISIFSKVAGKVDRLEYVLGGAPASQDEAALDTNYVLV